MADRAWAMPERGGCWHAVYYRTQARCSVFLKLDMEDARPFTKISGDPCKRCRALVRGDEERALRVEDPR